MDIVTFSTGKDGKRQMVKRDRTTTEIGTAEAELLIDRDGRQREAIRADAADTLSQGATINGRHFALDPDAIGRANGRLLRKGKLKFPTRVPALDGTYLTLNNRAELEAHDDALLYAFEQIESDMIDKIEALQ